MINSERLLHLAGQTISTRSNYGVPVDNLTRTARLWSAYLGTDINASQVAIMMTLLKLSRLAADPDHLDSWLDATAYLGIGAELHQPRTQNPTDAALDELRNRLQTDG